MFNQLSQLNLTTDPRARAIFEKAGVDHRHTVVDISYFAEERTTEARNQCYMPEALALGEETIRRCLDGSGYTVDDVDDLIVISCTGIDTPGLDLQLAGRLGLRPDLRRSTILGMGCYAAFPGLGRARDAVNAQPDRLVLMLAVELCSLHLQIDESLENMVSSALFADGAAAVLIGTPNGHKVQGPSLLDSQTYCEYNTLEHMAFHLTDHGFQMRLSAYVPELLAADIEKFVDQLLGRHHLNRDDIRFWGVHPGGRKIMDHIQARLELDDEDLQYSRAILRDYGNMSSPTVLFVLDQIQRQGQPNPGDYGVIMAFGPGLTMESMLVQW
jgi:alkylresorcinol/alkylpyrone synthase